MKHLSLGTSVILSLFLLSTIALPLFAQEKTKTIFRDAKEFTLIGKGQNSSPYYHRIDTSMYSELPKGVKRLLTNSSGLAVLFKTNSRKIEAKWTLSSYNVGDNMTPIVRSGLDLYIKKDGKWIYAGVGRPKAKNSSYTIVENMSDSEKECMLYLPLYNSIEDLEIGVDDNTSTHITSIPSPFAKKVVIYGSSITQGASASRAGMSYTSRIGRALNWEIINLGISGGGKMEKDAAHFTAAIDGDMYVLDCAANPSPQEITERTNYMVKHIRSLHPNKPIVMIQSVVRESGNFDPTKEKMVGEQNSNFETEYKRLIKEEVKDLYLIYGKDLLGHDHEGTTDGSHPNDLGFTRMIDIIQPQLAKIMKKY